MVENLDSDIMPTKQPRSMCPCSAPPRSMSPYPSLAEAIARSFVEYGKEEEEDEEEEYTDLDFPDPDDPDFSQRISQLAIDYYNHSSRNQNLEFVKVLKMRDFSGTLFHITFDARDINDHQVKAYFSSVEKRQGFYPMVHSCEEQQKPKSHSEMAESFQKMLIQYDMLSKPMYG